MRIATLARGNDLRPAVVNEQGTHAWPIAEARDVLDLIARYAELKPTIEQMQAAPAALELRTISLAAPIPKPARNVFCVGKNYYEHAREFGASGFDSSTTSAGDAIPTDPIIFSKVPESVISDGSPIRYPDGVSECIDYEAELAVVIGTGGRGIPRADAFRHVFGYTIVNDVTARDWQSRHKQWLLGKSFDTFCPMGPWIVTSDQLDASNLDIRCWVNGEMRQNANTRDLIFDIPTLIETISAGITLQPGDIISTGTPVGVGIGFLPPRYLKPGDTVKIEISGIGTLTNAVESYRNTPGK